MEAVYIAAAALVLSACAVFLVWPLTGQAICGDMGEIEPMGAASAMAVFATTAGCGGVALLSAALSSLRIMGLNPGEILSRLS
jgi:hypothetical protein